MCGRSCCTLLVKVLSSRESSSWSELGSCLSSVRRNPPLRLGHGNWTLRESTCRRRCLPRIRCAWIKRLDWTQSWSWISRSRCGSICYISATWGTRCHRPSSLWSISTGLSTLQHMRRCDWSRSGRLLIFGYKCASLERMCSELESSWACFSGLSIND